MDLASKLFKGDRVIWVIFMFLCLVSVIEVGTTVMLCVSHVKDIPNELKEMDQRIFRVKKVTNVSTNWKYYELYGCNSKAGVPFCIDEDWIQPVREVTR